MVVFCIVSKKIYRLVLLRGPIVKYRYITIRRYSKLSFPHFKAHLKQYNSNFECHFLPSVLNGSRLNQNTPNIPKSRLDFLIHIIITEKHSKGLHYYMCKTSYYLLLFLLGYFITYLTKLYFIMTSQNYNGNLYLLNNGKKKPQNFP